MVHQKQNQLTTHGKLSDSNMAKDFTGRELISGQTVVQAAASGHHKYLKVAVVLEVISDNQVRVQSESRPGIISWPASRLMILDDDDFLGVDKISELDNIYSEWLKKNV